jgi:tRNA threonylcarbamoyladenosine biosynthesis protein TsaE
MENTNKMTTHSPEETMFLAEKLAGILAPGDLVALKGDLGSGKTIFVKGLAKGLGVDEYEYVNSPSFVVVKEYSGKVPLYHFDVYRLNGKLFCETMDYEKYFYSQGISAVEWADKIQDTLPEEYLEVSLEYGTGDERIIFFKAKGERPGIIMNEFLERRK